VTRFHELHGALALALRDQPGPDTRQQPGHDGTSGHRPSQATGSGPGRH
jgi:hypothetical protein